MGCYANALDQFDDVRKIAAHIKSKGVEIEEENIGSESGPANMVLSDSDGNSILFDQHA